MAMERTRSSPRTSIDGGEVRGEFYVARDIPVDALVITEGELVIVEPEDLSSMQTKLTLVAQFAIRRPFREIEGGLCRCWRRMV